MYKIETDYSNTIIYKITCKDDSIKDVYVGHTTNFVQRKHGHKQSCLNIKCPSYKCKLYEVIRANGGWNNWKMEMINFFNCKDLYEARQKEQEFFISLNATLNSIEPLPRPKDKHIENNTQLEVSTHLENNTQLEVSTHLENNTQLEVSTHLENNSVKYSCAFCKITTSNKKDYNKHLLTRKHITNIESNNSKREELKYVKQTYECINCNRNYISRSGLWRHNKTCTESEEQTTTTDSLKYDVKNLLDLVMELTNTNIELTKKMTDMCNILINKSNPVIS